MTLKSMLSVTCGETTLKIKAINRDCDSETINIMRLKSGFTVRDTSKRADDGNASEVWRFHRLSCRGR